MSEKKPEDFAIEPRENNLYVKVDEPPDKSGSIYLSQEQALPSRTGTVIAAGPGLMRDDGTRHPMSYKAGDRVVFESVAGSPLYLWHYGIRSDTYRIISEYNILGKITKE